MALIEEQRVCVICGLHEEHQARPLVYAPGKMRRCNMTLVAGSSCAILILPLASGRYTPPFS
eukprot:2197972-Amphidinium_carterae.1